MLKGSLHSGGIWPKSNLIQAGMHVLVTYKKEDQIKNEGAGVVRKFLTIYVYEDFSRHIKAANSAICGSVWPHFKLINYRLYDCRRYLQ